MRSYNNNFFLKKNCQVSRLRQLSNEYIQVKMQNKNSMYHSAVKKICLHYAEQCFSSFLKIFQKGTRGTAGYTLVFALSFYSFVRFGGFNVCIFFRIRPKENLPMTSKCRAVCCDIILRLGRRQSRCMFLIAYIM